MRVRRLLAVSTPAAVVLCALGAGPVAAAPTSLLSPDYQMPFPCADTWTGTSRPDHSPSPLAIDFNKPGDLGALMVAAAPGTVTTVANLGNRSYGRYIVVDHGDGRSTLYAHLERQRVVLGQTVDAGQILGRVGGTGNVTGPHLHFEERLNGQDQHAYFDQASYAMGTTQSSRNCPDVPITGRWGSGTADGVGAFRRSKEGGRFRLHLPGKRAEVIAYGRSTDQPVTGDWNGDGQTDVGVRRTGMRAFLLRNPDGSTTRIVLGRVRSVPVTGDWDGDGKTDVGVWNPHAARFALRAADGSLTRIALGTPGSIPVTGDWDGDGRTDVGVYDPATQTFTLMTLGTSPSTRSVQFGSPGDLPVTGDWNGDGKTDVGVWTPGTGIYSLRVPGATARARAVVTSVRFGRTR